MSSRQEVKVEHKVSVAAFTSRDECVWVRDERRRILQRKEGWGKLFHSDIRTDLSGETVTCSSNKHLQEDICFTGATCSPLHLIY